MFRVYKFRLEPNVNQTQELKIALETHRRLYLAFSTLVSLFLVPRCYKRPDPYEMLIIRQ